MTWIAWSRASVKTARGLDTIALMEWAAIRRRAVVETLGLLATVIAVAGVVANNRKWRVCFWLWIVSNGLTAAIHAHAGIWSLCGRDVIFLTLAVEGLRLWKK